MPHANADHDHATSDAGEAQHRAATTGTRHPGGRAAGGPAGVGNRATGALVQRRLRVGAAGDRFEREADSTAATVMRRLRTRGTGDGGPGGTTQHRPVAVQRVPDAGGAGPVSHGPAGGAVDDGVASAISGSAGGGSPMPAAVQRTMGDAFGADFSGVRIHTDAHADQLSRSLNARAFTSGSDVYFASGMYDPASSNGQELLAHELTHTLQQQGAGQVQRRADMARMSRSEAVWRDDGTGWSQTDESVPKREQVVAVDAPSDSNSMGQSAQQIVRYDVPALLADTTGQPVPRQVPGKVPARSVARTGGSVEDVVAEHVLQDLVEREAGHPGLDGTLGTPSVARKLVTEALKLERMAAGSGLRLLPPKLRMLEQGADFTLDALDHWRRVVSGTGDPADVTITGFRLSGSDLHEQGLGVCMVRLYNPRAAAVATNEFNGQIHVDVVLKPEDKSLERMMLGAQPGSVVNQVNQLAGLGQAGPHQRGVHSMRMMTTEDYGSLIERVRGTEAQKFVGEARMHKARAFHETIVFAFLLGINDLHKENVFYDDDGHPFLIDADNVMNSDIMTDRTTDNRLGNRLQTGFGDPSTPGEQQVSLRERAGRTKQAIDSNGQQGDVDSRLLRTLVGDAATRTLIVDAIRTTLRAEHARVVPVRTAKWGGARDRWANSDAQAESNLLDEHSAEDFLVRKTSGFDMDIGTGLYGEAGEAAAGGDYRREEEKRSLREDFDRGVIPFYRYELDSGEVSHNGRVIYHGRTIDDAMQAMKQKFGG